MNIGFNKPYVTGKEFSYIQQAITNSKLSGDGIFSKKSSVFFEETFGFKKVLLTTSCTDALEMAAILLNIKEGDEVIMPSYTFVSTANAFLLRGAKIIFADSRKDHPGINEVSVEALITPKTKAIVVVHYAGVACDMDVIMKIANKHSLLVVEDAAQAIDSYYHKKALGSIGHFAAFSFHETKNIHCGEGGMLVINDEQFIKRAEIIREKGTNRSAFFRGEVDKYNWVDVGSSFLPSDMLAAFLYAQLEELQNIQHKRKEIWNCYYENLKELIDTKNVSLPVVPSFATNNAHMFYLLCNNLEERTQLIAFLNKHQINAVFHYISLHKSQFYLQTNPEKNLPQADFYTDCLIRLPMYYDLELEEVKFICNIIKKFYSH